MYSTKQLLIRGTRQARQVRQARQARQARWLDWGTAHLKRSLPFDKIEKKEGASSVLPASKVTELFIFLSSHIYSTIFALQSTNDDRLIPSNNPCDIHTPSPDHHLSFAYQTAYNHPNHVVFSDYQTDWLGFSIDDI
jgi:hypothetical protein